MRSFISVGKRKSKNFQYTNILSPKGQFISVDGGSPKLLLENLMLIKELAEEGKMKPVIDRCYPLFE